MMSNPIVGSIITFYLGECSMMRITKRGTNAKRHTVSYLVGGKWRTRRETAELARRGKIEDVYACRTVRGFHVQARPGSPRLYDLPICVSQLPQAKATGLNSNVQRKN